MKNLPKEIRWTQLPLTTSTLIKSIKQLLKNVNKLMGSEKQTQILPKVDPGSLLTSKMELSVKTLMDWSFELFSQNKPF